MKLVIVSSLLFVFIHARVIEQQCDGVIVHNINHEKETLKEGVQSPYQLAIDFDTSTLFFSYSNTDPDDDDIFKSAYLNLKTNKFGIIAGISGGFANAVDSKNHKVYLGGRDGIYNYDFETKRAKYLNGSNHNIWQMFFKDNLYYTSYPDERVYMYKNGEVSLVEELRDTKALLVAVDNNNNFFFSNSSGLFYYKRAKGKIFQLGEYTLNGFAANINGDLYFSTPDGIYYINTKKSIVVIEQILTTESIYGLAIEGDNNIIYADESSIVRLKPTKTICHVDEKKKSPVSDNTL